MNRSSLNRMEGEISSAKNHHSSINQNLEPNPAMGPSWASISCSLKSKASIHTQLEDFRQSPTLQSHNQHMHMQHMQAVPHSKVLPDAQSRGRQTRSEFYTACRHRPGCLFQIVDLSPVSWFHFLQLWHRKVPLKKCSFNLGIFQTRSDPPPPPPQLSS